MDLPPLLPGPSGAATEETLVPVHQPAARWATIIPLIGGSAIGCSLATGTRPIVHLTYTQVRPLGREVT